MHGTLPEKHKSRWCDHLNKMTYPYDCTKNDSTGYTAFRSFNRNPRLPMDLMFDLKPLAFGPQRKYVKKW